MGDQQAALDKRVAEQSCEAANQRSPEPGNTEPAKGGLDLLASGRTERASGVERNQRPFTFRLHEDSVEIACCLFNKQLLSGDSIDDAAKEIEAWMRALVAERDRRVREGEGNK